MSSEPMTPHLTDEDLLLDFYGEGTPEEYERVRNHLGVCNTCRTLEEELRSVLQAVETTPLTDPPSSLERDLWARIEPLLPVPHSRWRRLLSPRGLTPALYVAAAAASVSIIAAAFSAGRVWDRPPQPSTGNVIDDRAPVERLLRAEVEDHLERSQRMLVELVNADSSNQDSLRGDRARAADLVAAGRLYRRSAEEIGDGNVGPLLEDLERVLVEVANAPGTAGPDELSRLRQRIDDQDLLFRLRVATREIRERESRQQPSW